MERKRLDYIDFVKGIGILSVVFFHSYNGYDLSVPAFHMLKYITSFHMVLFFFLSGILFKPEIENYKQKIVSKVKSLIIPYLVWGCVIGSCVEVLRRMLGTQGIEGFGVANILKQTANGDGMVDGSWFLYTLFAVYMLEFLLSFICKKTSVKYQGVVMFVLHLALGVGGYFVGLAVGDLFKIPHILIASMFFYFGFLFANSELQIKEFVYPILFVLGGVLCFVNNESVSFALLDFGIYPIFVLSALMTIIGLIGMSQMLFDKQSKLKFPLLRYYGKNSIIVLMTHMILMFVVVRMLEKLLHMEIHTFPALASFVIISALELLVIRLMPKFLKATFGMFPKSKRDKFEKVEK